MTLEKTKKMLLVSVACVMLAPAGAVAQDYLKGKTSAKPLGQIDPQEMTGDIPADFHNHGVDTQGNVGAKRQRVESRVEEYRRQLFKGGSPETHSDDHGLTPQGFQQLVVKAQTGDPVAIGGVAYAYQHGIGTDEDEKMAVEWYKRAIEYGQIQHYTTIGKIYRDYGADDQKSGFFSGLKKVVTGDDSGNVTDDDAIARTWIEKGVAAKDWEAYLELGMMYRDGAGGLEKDMKLAKWYYDEGLKMKKRHDAKVIREMVQKVRVQAEIEEGIRPAGAPAIGGNVSSIPSTTIGEHYCTLREMNSPTGQYSAFFEAYCGGLEETQKSAAPATAFVRGMSCDITAWPANEASKDFEVRCK